MKAQEAITKQEISRIYALGAGVGLVERGNPDDLLHIALRNITGKDSVRELTHAEYLDMQHYLIEQMQLKNRKQPLKQRKPSRSAKHEERPGGITADQQRMVWYLMYQLRDKDGNAYASTSLGVRLCGIIRKQLRRDCTEKDPFRFITMADGWRLIEALKGMVANTKPKDGVRNAQ
jgi:hypothetical protein